MRKSRFRFKDYPDHVMEITPEKLARVAALFSLRHEIVHNPNEKSLRESSPDLACFLTAAWDFVFCANQLIENFVRENLKASVSVAGPDTIEIRLSGESMDKERKNDDR